MAEPALSEGPMTSVCVFCAANAQIDPVHIKTAFELGAAIAARGWTLVSGGGSVSSMGAVADGARSKGGQTIGVIPKALFEKEVADHDSSELIVSQNMRDRKAEMENRSDAFIVLPGGIGTLEEFFEIWVSRSLGMHDKPVLVLDPVGLYQPLQTWLNQLTELGFISAESAQCVYWTKGIETALDQITQELANPVTRQGTDAEIVEAEL